MKRLSFITVITLVCACRVLAQDTSKVVKRIISSVPVPVKLDTNDLAYDESGQALRYYQYMKLLKSGKYSLRLKNVPGEAVPKKYLVKLTEQDIAYKVEAFEQIAVVRSPLLVKNLRLDINPLLDYISELELGNKKILLYFWYSNCPPCVEAFSLLDEMLQQVDHPENILVLSITKDTREQARNTLLVNPFKKGRLISDAGSIAQAYQLSGYPTFVVVDQDRVIRFSVTGYGPYTMQSVKKYLNSTKH